MTDVDLHATQHTEVAAFKSLLPVLQQGIALVGEYSELRAHLEVKALVGLIFKEWENSGI